LKPKYILCNLAIIISTMVTVFSINSILQMPIFNVDVEGNGPRLYFHDIPEEVLRRDEESRNNRKYTEVFKDIHIDGNYYSRDAFDSSARSESDTSSNSQAVIGSQKVVSIEQNISGADKLEILKIMAKVPAKDTLKIIGMMRDGITQEEQNEMYYLLQDKVGQDDLNRLIEILQGYVED
jgi:hypothetical protein